MLGNISALLQYYISDVFNNETIYLRVDHSNSGRGAHEPGLADGVQQVVVSGPDIHNTINNSVTLEKGNGILTALGSLPELDLSAGGSQEVATLSDFLLLLPTAATTSTLEATAALNGSLPAAGNNSSTLPPEVNLSDILGPQRAELYKVIPVTVIYCIIFVTGIVGNVSTCIVIARNRYMQTATNYYLFNLAIADLLMLVLGLPQETYSFWSAYPWIFGETFCVIRTMAAETSTYASILTITAFTVERYVAICHPMRAQTMSSLPRAIKVIVCIWIVSLICSVPMVLQFGIVFVRDARGVEILESATCTIKSEQALDHTFEISTFLFFLAPMTIISVLYGLIGYAVRESALSRAGSDTSHHSEQTGTALRVQQQARARRAVLKMLVAVVVAFFICWAPFHTQRLMVVYIQKEAWTQQLTRLFNILYYLSGILYYVSSTINPILYNIMSLKFRQAFKNTIFRRCRRRPKRPKVVAYKFYSKPLNSDSYVTMVAVAANGKAHRAQQRRTGPSQSSSASGGSSAKMLNNDDPFEGMELEHMIADAKSHSYASPRTCVSNANYRPYHSYA